MLQNGSVLCFVNDIFCFRLSSSLPTFVPVWPWSTLPSQNHRSRCSVSTRYGAYYCYAFHKFNIITYPVFGINQPQFSVHTLRKWSLNPLCTGRISKQTIWNPHLKSRLFKGRIWNGPVFKWSGIAIVPTIQKPYHIIANSGKIPSPNTRKAETYNLPDNSSLFKPVYYGPFNNKTGLDHLN